MPSTSANASNNVLYRPPTSNGSLVEVQKGKTESTIPHQDTDMTHRINHIQEIQKTAPVKCHNSRLDCGVLILRESEGLKASRNPNCL
ncbi:hypothetical protein QE152_g15355 [Popillia japonica]|uniref:Uncharacterized protein n=1 Tax=Popillia japonica TaxID=7064 RepID=A0AAW1L8Q3_POPJA